MSTASLLSVVSNGVQDTRLLTPKGQPNINNYVKVFKKTTRWAAQWIRVDFDGSPDLGKKNTCTIPRKGELLSQVTLVVTMPDIATTQQNARNACTPETPFIGPTFGWTNNLGHALINLVEFDIGGVNVDQFDGRFMEIYDELYESNESVRAKNRMLNRIPNGFTSSSIGNKSGAPTTCYVPIPLWFSQTQCALPLDALSADAVQLHISLRPINELFYTDARIDPRNPLPLSSTSQTTTATPPITGAQFYRANPSSNTIIYKTTQNQQNQGISGEVIPDIQMPARLQIQDAYLLCEYISLEEYEALLLRSAMLEYRVEQHYIVPPHYTQSSPNVRFTLPYSNPVKDIQWVCQNPLVSNYNAWFLFTRDMYAATTFPDEWWKMPWFPDAVLSESDEALPAFRDAYSEPLLGVELTFANVKRFSHMESPSLFRSLLPIIHYRKAPLFNRYIYTFPFGLAPGASDDKSLGAPCLPRGFANFDKLPKKELSLTMAKDNASNYPNLIVYTYVTTWNIFRVFGGRGVMLFAY